MTMVVKKEDSSLKAGFTIVELLIVVVVIAILAAITVVAFAGIRERADQAAVRSEVSSFGKKLETFKVDPLNSEQYPASLAAVGLGTAGPVTYTYLPNVSSGNRHYCLAAERGVIQYFRTNVSDVAEGNCDVTSGLVGWWRFNGNSNDSGTGANNGVVTNATLTAAQDGSANNAYAFNGTSAYITANTTSIERTSFTATAWFRTGTVADRKILSTQSGGAHIVQVMVPGGVLRTCINACFLGTRVVADNNWHFVAAVGSATGLRVYLDGQQVPEVTSAYAGTTSLGTQVRIGADYTPSFFFNGQMDDIRLYDRPLSVEETQILYSAGAR